VHGQQEHERQGQDGGDDQLRARAEVLVVHVVSRGPAGWAPAFYHRSGALCADQVFAAHRHPFRLARVPASLALAAM
jgi:hypothetical protein